MIVHSHQRIHLSYPNYLKNVIKIYHRWKRRSQEKVAFHHQDTPFSGRKRTKPQRRRISVRIIIKIVCFSYRTTSRSVSWFKRGKTFPIKLELTEKSILIVFYDIIKMWYNHKIFIFSAKEFIFAMKFFFWLLKSYICEFIFS